MPKPHCVSKRQAAACDCSGWIIKIKPILSDKHNDTHSATQTEPYNTWLWHNGCSDKETNKQGWKYCLLRTTIQYLLLKRLSTQPVSASVLFLFSCCFCSVVEWWCHTEVTSTFQLVYCPAMSCWGSRGVRRGPRPKGWRNLPPTTMTGNEPKCPGVCAQAKTSIDRSRKPETHPWPSWL